MARLPVPQVVLVVRAVIRIGDAAAVALAVGMVEGVLALGAEEDRLGGQRPVAVAGPVEPREAGLSPGAAPGLAVRLRREAAAAAPAGAGAGGGAGRAGVAVPGAVAQGLARLRAVAVGRDSARVARASSASRVSGGGFSSSARSAGTAANSAPVNSNALQRSLPDMALSSSLVLRRRGSTVREELSAEELLSHFLVARSSAIETLPVPGRRRPCGAGALQRSSKAGEGRRASGPTWSVAMTSHRNGGPNPEGSR